MKKEKDILLHNHFTNELQVGGDLAWLCREYNPSTGYNWVCHPDNSGVYEIVSQVTLYPSTNAVGVSGMIIWKLKALKEGKGSVLFELCPPSGKTPIESIIINIKVNKEKILMAAPIKVTYDLTPQINIVTTITGDNRDQTVVIINDINTEMWSGSMMKASPAVVTPNDLKIGNTTIKSGAAFHLVPPSAFQQGRVTLECEMKSGDNPFFPYSAVVATWNLS